MRHRGSGGFQRQRHDGQVREPMVNSCQKSQQICFKPAYSIENDSRDVVDGDDRTALIFVSGLGSELCVRVLAEAGVNLDHNDNGERSTTLHMMAGYVWPGVVKLLVQRERIPT